MKISFVFEGALGRLVPHRGLFLVFLLLCGAAIRCGREGTGSLISKLPADRSDNGGVRFDVCTNGRRWPARRASPQHSRANPMQPGFSQVRKYNRIKPILLLSNNLLFLGLVADAWQSHRHRDQEKQAVRGPMPLLHWQFRSGKNGLPPTPAASAK
jgi:hypothetical protein